MAHMLNDEYFTIHPTLAGRDIESSTGRLTDGAAASTYVSRLNTGEEEEVQLEEIRNIPTLMNALKLAIVDREKIEFLKRFVEQGGEELYYLEERVLSGSNSAELVAALLTFIRSQRSCPSSSSRTRDGSS